MTLAERPQSKTDRRAALESPFAQESEQSISRAMSRGIQPKGLDQLVRWFREACHEEAPTTIHKDTLWRDWGRDGDGGSLLGTLAWSEPFRRFIEAVDHPSAVDADGRYRLPLRAALSRWARHPKYAVPAQYLYQLALLDGDYRRLADNLSYPVALIEMFLETALYRLWREYSDVKLWT